MSSVQRVLSGAALCVSLPDEIRIVRDELATAGERIGRTLIKDGPVRLTLVALKAGGRLRDHRADGPITVQVLEGSVDFHVSGGSIPLTVGSVLFGGVFPAGIL